MNVPVAVTDEVAVTDTVGDVDTDAVTVADAVAVADVDAVRLTVGEYVGVTDALAVYENDTVCDVVFVNDTVGEKDGVTDLDSVRDVVREVDLVRLYELENVAVTELVRVNVGVVDELSVAVVVPDSEREDVREMVTVTVAVYEADLLSVLTASAPGNDELSLPPSGMIMDAYSVKFTTGPHKETVPISVPNNAGLTRQRPPV
jgi:hypothetical protein